MLRLLGLPIAVAALSAPAPVASAATIQGTVANSANFRVVFLAPNGTAHTRKLNATGAFSFTAGPRKMAGATLHLVRPNGRYFGPIVLRYDGSRFAWTRLSASGGQLGRITRRAGFARVGSAIPDAVLSPIAISADAEGRPKGAGRSGLVKMPARSRQRQAGAMAEDTQGSDYDGDGIQNVFDVDDDGDKMLDSVDPQEAGGDGLQFTSFSNLPVEIEDTVNVNAGGVTRDAVDQMWRDSMLATLVFPMTPSQVAEVSSIDVACFTLRYCKRGTATATMIDAPAPHNTFGDPWLDYDPNGNGLPNMWQTEFGMEARIQLHAGLNDVHIGDTFLANVVRSGRSIQVPSSINFLFSTTPALRSVTAGGIKRTLTYPTTDGSRATPDVVAGTPLDLEIWRPQRPIVPGAESGGYRDMGGLAYGITFTVFGDSNVYTCRNGDDYSQLSSTLRKPGYTAMPLRDIAPDAPPSAANTLSFRFDLGACMTRHGLDPAGKTVTLEIESMTREGDNARQLYTVTLP